MKFKSLPLFVGFIPAMVMAQPSKIEAPVPPKASSAGTPGANGGGVKPAAPVAVNPSAKPKQQMNQSSPQPAVGATGGNGGNGGLFVGNGGNGGNGATPKPPPTMYSGVGPLPANDAIKPPAPQPQVGKVNTQLSDGRTLQSSNQLQQQVGAPNKSTLPNTISTIGQNPYNEVNFGTVLPTHGNNLEAPASQKQVGTPICINCLD